MIIAITIVAEAGQRVEGPWRQPIPGLAECLQEPDYLAVKRLASEQRAVGARSHRGLVSSSKRVADKDDINLVGPAVTASGNTEPGLFLLALITPKTQAAGPFFIDVA